MRTQHHSQHLFMVFAASIMLVAIVSIVLTTIAALRQSSIRFSAPSRPTGEVLGVTAFSGTDADGDGYMSIATGGTDCYDSLMSQYSDGTATCDSTANATTFSADGLNGNTAKPGDSDIPIVDHSWIQDPATGLWHIFFQNDNGTYVTEDIEHFTSTNLTGDLHYVDTPLLSGTGTWDEQLWAPNVIYNSSDGKYYMFYAGVTANSVTQRIGLATADSLNGPWTRVTSSASCDSVTGDGCVYNCNASWTTWDNGGYADAQCRDPNVIWDVAHARWLMFATTRLDTAVVGTPGTQAITVATSSDLQNWSHLGYVRATRRHFDGDAQLPQNYGGVTENPFVASYNGTYYLFFTDYYDELDTVDPNELCDMDPTCTMVQYATTTDLTADASGSLNWIYRGYHDIRGMNATEIVHLSGDTWVASSSMANGHVTNQVDSTLDVSFAYANLTWHRVLWTGDGTYTMSKLTKPTCRRASNSIYPGASELCSDNVDQNCSGTTDEELYCAASCTDVDGDGYGVNGLYACAHATLDTNDNDAAIYPGASEICDGKDNNSDGQIDEGGVCICTESWTCGVWSSCSGTTRTRTCTDGNSCGTTATKPATSETCTAIITGSIDVTPSSTGAYIVWETNQASESRVRFGLTASYGALAFSLTPTTSHAITLSELQSDTVYHYELSSTGTTTATSDDATFRTLKKSSPPVVLPPPPEDEVIKISVVVTGTKSDVAPYVKIFTVNGKLLKTFFAYSSFFRGGVNVAVGDVTGDGKDDIITAPGPGASPTIRIFDMNGKTLRKDFAAFPGLFRNGVTLSVADLDGDQKKEVVVAPVKGAPQLRVFKFRNGKFVPLIPSIFAFSRTAQNGLVLGASDLDADGRQEILAAQGLGSPPVMRVFGVRGGVLRQIIPDTLIGPAASRDGVSLVGATTSSGVHGVASVPSSGGSSLVRWFVRDKKGKMVRMTGGFLAFHPAFRGGVNLAGCDLNTDGSAELIAAVGSAGNPLVRIFDTNGKMAFPEFYAFSKSMKYGLTISCGTK